MNPVRLRSGNIWSGSKTLAVFTNPTELAFKKGNLKHHWPIRLKGKDYSDAEAAFHFFKQAWHSFSDLQNVVTDIIVCKFQQYPILVDSIKISGGSDWIKQCSHFCGARTTAFKRWEGQGVESAFICCLLLAFESIK